MLKLLFAVFIFVSGAESACETTDQVEIQDTCFQFITNQTLTWDDAREFCNEAGGQMAIIPTCSLLGQLARYITLNGLDGKVTIGFWVGSSDLNYEGYWHWVDGTNTELGIPFWGRDEEGAQPNGGEDENCAMMFAEDLYYLHDQNCSTNANFICEFSTTAATSNHVPNI